jgi:hypothetical protein
MKPAVLLVCLGLCLNACASSAMRRSSSLEEPVLASEVEQGCKPLLRHLELDKDERRRYSCWHRIWEVPVSLVAYPAAAGIILGAVTSPIWVPLILLK